MEKLTVFGGVAPRGEIKISGSKNEVLPIIFASLLTNGISEILGVPDISDVSVALDIIRGFGARCERRGDFLSIDTRSLKYAPPDRNLTERLRASTYLIGSMLSRFGRCPLTGFGGCSFSARPIDMHIMALECLSGRAFDDCAIADRLLGADIHFNKRSVGATVNALLLSACAEGVSRIYGYAREAHVKNLIAYLQSAGADITLDEEKITVVGKELSGGKIKIAPDVLEGATYLNISALCGGEVYLTGIELDDFQPLAPTYSRLGFRIFRDRRGVFIRRVAEARRTEIIAEPEPGFPTDLQPIFAPLVAYNAGGSIEDRVFPSRFGYLSELAKYGVKCSGSYSKIELYPSTPRPATSNSLDLRAGMAQLISALYAEGRSEILSSELIFRGYDALLQKLSALSLSVSLS